MGWVQFSRKPSPKACLLSREPSICHFASNTSVRAVVKSCQTEALGLASTELGGAGGRGATAHAWNQPLPLGLGQDLHLGVG